MARTSMRGGEASGAGATCCARRTAASGDVKTVRPEHSIRDVARLMREENVGIVPVTDSGGRLLGLVMGRKQVRRLPVVERDNRLVGIIAMADIATRADQDEELQEALERISQRRSFWSRLG